MRPLKNLFKLVWYFLNSKLRNSKNSRLEYKRKRHFLYLQQFANDINKSNKVPKNNPAIDVLIPAIERDLMVLKYTISSLRKFSTNEIQTIFIVAPNSDSIRNFAIENNCRFILEDTLTKVIKKEINYIIDGNDRSGWLYQQFLKLNWNKLSDKKYCLVFDSDTILIRPQTFVHNDKIVFNCSDEYHLPYYKTYKILFSYLPKLPLSFVSHYMVFERESTLEMKKHIEQQTGLEWEKAILKNVDYKENSGFSEYESYGHFMHSNYRNIMEINYWYNESFNKLKFPSVDQILSESKKNIKSISFHWYNN